MNALRSRDDLDTIPVLPDDVPVTMPDLPARLIFDVLVVPGSEQLSAALNTEPAPQGEEETQKEPLLSRLLAHF